VRDARLISTAVMLWRRMGLSFLWKRKEFLQCKFY